DHMHIIRAFPENQTRQEVKNRNMNGKELRLIQPVSKRDQVVSSFKEAILSGVIQPGLPPQTLGDLGKRVPGRMPGARRGAALRLLLDEGPPPRRVVPLQRRATRKDS